MKPSRIFLSFVFVFSVCRIVVSAGAQAKPSAEDEVAAKLREAREVAKKAATEAIALLNEREAVLAKEQKNLAYFQNVRTKAQRDLDKVISLFTQGGIRGAKVVRARSGSYKVSKDIENAANEDVKKKVIQSLRKWADLLGFLDSAINTCRERVETAKKARDATAQLAQQATGAVPGRREKPAVDLTAIGLQFHVARAKQADGSVRYTLQTLTAQPKTK